MLRTLRKLTGQGRCGIDYLSAAFHRPNQACRMASTLPSTPIFCALASHDPKSTAILHYPSGRRFTYGDLLGDVAYEQQSLQAAAGSGAFGGERVAFLIENSYDYVGANSLMQCEYRLDLVLVQSLYSRSLAAMP